MRGLRAKGPERKGDRPWIQSRVVQPRSDKSEGSLGQLWDSLEWTGVPRGVCGDCGVGWGPRGSGPHWGPKGHRRGFWATCGGSRLVQGPEERPKGCWAGLESQGESQGSLSRLWRLWPGPGSRGASQKSQGWTGITRGIPRGLGRAAVPVGVSGGSALGQAGVPREVRCAPAGPGRGWGRGAPAPHKGRGSGGRAQSGTGGS